jgi:hypothetical protein
MESSAPPKGATCEFCLHKEARYRCKSHHGVGFCSNECLNAHCLVDQLAQLSSDQDVQRRLGRLGLQAQTVQWEDVGRSKGSVWGPNISDMTLSCHGQDMPAIRHPNFEDTTVDVSCDKFSVVVGNEHRDRPLRRITLQEYLRDIGMYTGSPKLGSMYRPRDASLVVSGQSCILPLHNGKVSFHPNLYNYQSIDGDPALLTILATQQGTSCQVIGSGKTPLYFNDHGNAVEMVAKRLADDRAEKGLPTTGPMTQEEQERNVMYIFSVPLKIKERPRANYESMVSFSAVPKSAVGYQNARKSRSKTRGYDHAVLEKGTEIMGPYKGTRDLTLERDDRFPIRCTVQTYAVTDRPSPPDDVLQLFADQIKRLHKQGLNEGSLVLEPNKGRPTEHNVPIWSQPPKGVVIIAGPLPIRPFVFF